VEKSGKIYQEVGKARKASFLYKKLKKFITEKHKKR
jgi:hypothetical protein